MPIPEIIPPIEIISIIALRTLIPSNLPLKQPIEIIKNKAIKIEAIH